MASDRVLALDIGGTKLAAAAVDREGEVSDARVVATPRTVDAEELFATLVDLGRAVQQGAGGVAAVGVGCGGPMQPGGATVSPLNIPAWREFPLRDRLHGVFGLPAWVDNDAKALARAEGWLGAAAGLRDYVGMVVSTGVGGGVVVDGRLLEGASGNAGHIGHVIVEPDGRSCACGGQGCLEAEASGPAIEAAFGVAPAEAPLPVRERTGALVGRAVASVVAVTDVRLAVVAGSVALGFGRPFFSAANAELRRRAGLSFARRARIVPGALGANGPLVGAAAVAFAGMDPALGGHA